MVPPIVHYHWNLDTPFRAPFSSRTEHLRVDHIDRAFDSLVLIILIIDKSAPLAFTRVESPPSSRSSHRLCCIHPLGLPETDCSPGPSLTTDEIRLADLEGFWFSFANSRLKRYLGGLLRPKSHRYSWNEFVVFLFLFSQRGFPSPSKFREPIRPLKKDWM